MMTAAQKPRITAGLLEPVAIPANPARNTAPVARQYQAQPVRLARARVGARTRVAAIRHANPRAPATACSPPCTVGWTGGPAAVPEGKPFIGSAVNAPAPTRPRP